MKTIDELTDRKENFFANQKNSIVLVPNVRECEVFFEIRITFSDAEHFPLVAICHEPNKQLHNPTFISFIK